MRPQFTLFNIEITERLMPAFFIGFAVKLLLTNVIATIPAYAYAAFLPELVWALIFLAVGVFQFIATQYCDKKFRQTALLACASLWLLWAILIIAARTSGFGEIIWTLIGIQCFMTYHRLKHSPEK